MNRRAAPRAFMTVCLLFAAGCDFERTDREREDEGHCVKPKPANVQPAPQPAPQSTSNRYDRSKEEVEALKRDIEELRKKLNIASSSQTTEELVKIRTAATAREQRFRAIDVLSSRCKPSMTRAECTAWLGDPDDSRTDHDEIVDLYLGDTMKIRMYYLKGSFVRFEKEKRQFSVLRPIKLAGDAFKEKPEMPIEPGPDYFNALNHFKELTGPIPFSLLINDEYDFDLSKWPPKQPWQQEYDFIQGLGGTRF